MDGKKKKAERPNGSDGTQTKIREETEGEKTMGGEDAVKKSNGQRRKGLWGTSKRGGAGRRRHFQKANNIGE